MSIADAVDPPGQSPCKYKYVSTYTDLAPENTEGRQSTGMLLSLCSLAQLNDPVVSENNKP